MANRVPITIRVDRFEGPLDLLLYLIQSHELDVSKISIAKITEQYVAYVRLMQELNFDIASDFLLMAATLIQWKSKSLLPVDVDPNALLNTDDDALSPEELLRQLREHQRFLEMGRELGTLTLLGDDVFTRPNTRKPTEKVWKQMDVTGLALTFQDLLVKERKRTTILKKETVSLSEKILDFGERMEIGKLTGLRALLRDPNSRPETVVSFLATLELGRLRKMRLHQEKVYEEIYVELLESIKGFDTALASGFDAIEASIDKDIKDRDDADAATAAAARAVADSKSEDAVHAAFDRATDVVADRETGAEVLLADFSGAEASDAGIRGVEDALAGRDYSGAGVDLHTFGEDRGPRLADLLAGTDGDAGTDDGSGEDLRSSPTPGTGNLTDGGRDADTDRNDFERTDS